MNSFRKLILIFCIMLGAAGTTLYVTLTQKESPTETIDTPSCPLQDQDQTSIQDPIQVQENQENEPASESNEIQSIPAIENTEKIEVPVHNAPTRTYPHNKPFLTGFQSQKQIMKLKNLTVCGCIPEWLYGSYVSVGPAQFEVGKTKARHWLDGFGMIHRFSFKKGRVSYANQFINSLYYRDSLTNETMNNAALASDPNASYFSKLRAALSDSDNRPPYDNTNIGIINHNNRWITLTETPHMIEIDRHTLKSENDYVFKDKLKMHTMIAHPITDPDTGELFGVGTAFGHKSTYTLFKLEPDSFEREMIAQLSTGYPSYLHSFALTKKSIILTQIPFVLNPYDLISSSKPFIENFVWKPKQKTALSIFDRQSGELINTFYIDPKFIFNHVNAFQDGDVITLDVLTHADPSMISDYAMENLFSNNPYQSAPATLTRITLNLETGTVDTRPLTQSKLEWPRINPAYSLKPYRYVWGLSSSTAHEYYNMVVKVDIQTGKTMSWSEPLCYMSEPTFVAKPHDTQEDSGVIMSIVLNPTTGKSFLIILDAQSMKEIGRAQLPTHIPFIVHGTWMPHPKSSLKDFIKEEVFQK